MSWRYVTTYTHFYVMDMGSPSNDTENVNAYLYALCWCHIDIWDTQEGAAWPIVLISSTFKILSHLTFWSNVGRWACEADHQVQTYAHVQCRGAIPGRSRGGRTSLERRPWPHKRKAKWRHQWNHDLPRTGKHRCYSRTKRPLPWAKMKNKRTSYTAENYERMILPGQWLLNLNGILRVYKSGARVQCFRTETGYAESI